MLTLNLEEYCDSRTGGTVLKKKKNHLIEKKMKVSTHML